MDFRFGFYIEKYINEKLFISPLKITQNQNTVYSDWLPPSFNLHSIHSRYTVFGEPEGEVHCTP